MLSRLLSPAGFVLVLLLFLLPFAGISCSTQDIGSMEADVTGFDLVTNGDPTFETDSPIADQVASDQAEMPTTDVSALAIPVLALIVAGIGCAVLARPRTRMLAAGAVAALAAALLVVTQLVAESNLVSNIVDNARILQATVPNDLSPVANETFLADAVGPRIGFWLSLAALVLLAAGNLVAMARAPRSLRIDGKVG